MRGVNLGGQRLVYSTSELQAALTIDRGDVMLLYGRAGETGETVLRYASAPTVTLLEGTATSAFDAAKGDLRLDYTHAGRAVVRITGGGRPALTLIIADEAEAVRYWRGSDAVLVRGPALLRSTKATGGTLALTGDTADTTPLEIWAPTALRSAQWNGTAVATKATVIGSRTATAALPGPAPVVLPALTNWRMAQGSPEATPGFRRQQLAGDRRTRQCDDDRKTRWPTEPDDGLLRLPRRRRLVSRPLHRHARCEADRAVLRRGGSGMVQVWVDDQFVGQNELPSGLPRPITTGLARFDLPASAQSNGEHVVSVMVRNNGHNWDLDSDDYHKEARGLVSASIEAPGGRSFGVPIAWKIQGKLGGEELPDPARGPANNGGQYGERFGWHLPGFDDKAWVAATIPATTATPGTTWYRTRFDLAVPKGQDTTIALAFGDTTTPRSVARYRALLFVNGWNMGQFIAHVGPQRVFPIPEGIINHHGANTVALAVTSDGAPGDAIEQVRLVTMRTVKGGVPVRMVAAPDRLGAAK
ncbi:beta galactosidase jelly roll domain-containing protein [Sphingomonas sp. H160509]|uniref:beta galactosidase jelly roll domain-containing protein n=1 Tax=Sphingomonas sp. H160509 TaxID=2955313 RepID=UPI00209708C5|nr:beta galactosidase jelly roll domain-containing protein [Sphingomonas sp. H160509]MDD1451118.1 beta galactosidase jelly roll domain-containing protein [Sphingomonas sp. H160509]